MSTFLSRRTMICQVVGIFIYYYFTSCNPTQAFLTSSVQRRQRLHSSSQSYSNPHLHSNSRSRSRSQSIFFSPDYHHQKQRQQRQQQHAPQSPSPNCYLHSQVKSSLSLMSPSSSRHFFERHHTSRTPTTSQLHAEFGDGNTPVLDRWQVLPNGSIIGTVRNHPAIDDGDVITTSPITDPNTAKSQMIVETASGSKYQLLTPLQQPYNFNGASIPEVAPPAAGVPSFRIPGFGEDLPGSTSGSSNGGSGSGSGGIGLSSSSTFDPLSSSSSNNGNGNDAASSATQQGNGQNIAYPKIRSGPAWKEATTVFQLAQQFIGLDEEYLLAGKPVKSTSGKSNIWIAYEADDATGGLPKVGALAVCIKVSSNLEAVTREYENYRKLSFLGVARGKFVKCHTFFPVAGKNQKFKNQCALVLERGSEDLKTFLNSRGRLEGNELRNACMAAAQCVQALHNVGLVWTDLKTENFVVMDNGDVKGIDLESAMPVGDNPVDYSPEACPPEFALAFLEGEGPYFVLDPAYDVWSLGMLILELSSGEGFFDGQTPAQITKWLRDCESGIPVDNIQIDDDRLRDLLRRCLQKDPKKRPNMAQILLHPYFITSPLSIFQNFT